MSINICPCCKGKSIYTDIKEETSSFLCTGCEIKMYDELHELMEKHNITKEDAFRIVEERRLINKKRRKEGTDNMQNTFFAMLARMRYIERWSLMRSSDRENISEHSLEVAIIAHGLAIISNVRLGNNLNVEKAALIGMYHDCTEIITGDMPTPIKYQNEEIKRAYKQIEEWAADRLLVGLPEDMREYYTSLFYKTEEDEYLWKIVKAADKLSALIKCRAELKAGNKEFSSAERTILNSLVEMNMKEVNIFASEFLPLYLLNLDELQK